MTRKLESFNGSYVEAKLSNESLLSPWVPPEHSPHPQWPAHGSLLSSPLGPDPATPLGVEAILGALRPRAVNKGVSASEPRCPWMLPEEPGGHVPLRVSPAKSLSFLPALFPLHPHHSYLGMRVKNAGFQAPSQTSSRRPWNCSSPHQASDSWGHQSSRNTSSYRTLQD